MKKKRTSAQAVKLVARKCPPLVQTTSDRDMSGGRKTLRMVLCKRTAIKIALFVCLSVTRLRCE